MAAGVFALLADHQAELDRFCDAMIRIREEIRAIEQGKSDRVDNVLKNAPHTADSLIDVPHGIDPSDRFLPQVTPLGEAHGPLHDPRLGHHPAQPRLEPRSHRFERR